MHECIVYELTMQSNYTSVYASWMQVYLVPGTLYCCFPMPHRQAAYSREQTHRLSCRSLLPALYGASSQRKKHPKGAFRCTHAPYVPRLQP